MTREDAYIALGVVGLVMVGFFVGFVVLVFLDTLRAVLRWARQRLARRHVLQPLDRLQRELEADVRAREERARRQERAASAVLLPTTQRRVRREPCGASGRRTAGT